MYLAMPGVGLVCVCVCGFDVYKDVWMHAISNVPNK